MENSKIYEAAKKLYISRNKLIKIPKLPNDLTPQNFEDAYAIQDELLKIYLKKNNTIIGKKVGCTNKLAQEQLNVSEPFYGSILSLNISKSNCAINSNNFFSPFIEPEFSFKINKDFDMSKAPFSYNDIFNSLECVLPSIEIVDSRYLDWTTIGIYNLIADNAAHSHWIHGSEIKDFTKFNFYDHLVTLQINNKIIFEGNSNKVLNNPINSIVWLINTLAKQDKKIHKNDYISTGTCTPATPIKKNDKIIADFGKIGKIVFEYN